MIVVIEHGRISQTGTHAELMSKDGKYRSMVEQQIHMTLGNFTTPMTIGPMRRAYVMRFEGTVLLWWARSPLIQDSYRISSRRAGELPRLGAVPS